MYKSIDEYKKIIFYMLCLDMSLETMVFVSKSISYLSLAFKLPQARIFVKAV
jgi:hypothetical protein